MSFIWLGLTDRDQWHAQIAHFFEQPMQLGLVYHGSGKKCVAVLFECDDQALEPARILRIQMTLEPDLIDHGLAWNGFWFELVWHVLVPLVAGHKNPFHLLMYKDNIPHTVLTNRHFSVGMSVVFGY